MEKKMNYTVGSELSIPSIRKDANKNMTKILNAAKQIFAEKGLDSTIEDVAKKAGVGIGTIYRRFSNKHQLATAVVLDLFEEIYEEQVEIAHSHFPADKKILMVYEQFASFSRQNGKIHKMALEMMNDLDDLENNLQKSFFTHFKEILRNIIIQGQEEGIFREGNPEIYVILLFNMTNPQVVFQLEPLVPYQEIPRYVSQMILKGLGK